jgi:hypothetical protein
MQFYNKMEKKYEAWQLPINETGNTYNSPECTRKNEHFGKKWQIGEVCSPVSTWSPKISRKLEPRLVSEILGFLYI